MKWISQCVFSPSTPSGVVPEGVRHAPDSPCDMRRIRCATCSGFTVRHAPDYAVTSVRVTEQVETKGLDQGIFGEEAYIE